ncbi:hypothetical protein ABE65_011655 [Fictibacillus phosphorivorans]|uniref:Knr4/Smi1-like domain-containing protein n=1 Tax=Fictibacillus phosphorivorans TaxID=1221500 RepID=A0A160IP59_9BACL|nr:SMI1/KNR4 family protein [Fictibacillus phosphorivorans]ANC77422.1 hypothetical protein ABE65_011655 [Fictibacillus phosphorivorans]
MNLWRLDIDEDMYKLSSLTKEMITYAENLFDVFLPVEYLQILSIQNGGYLLHDTYSSNSSIEIQIDHLLGIGRNIGILDTPYFQEEWNLPKGLILIGGDGHEWVALDYRYCRTSPPIVYINSEEETITTIAASFNEFLTNLNEPKDTILKLTESYSSDQNFYHQVDELMKHGTPISIDQFFSKTISTNKIHIKYMVDKMWRHPNPKVQFYLMLYLSECAEGNNQGMIDDDDLHKMLIDIKHSKNNEAKELAEYSLDVFYKRNNGFRI